MAPEPLPSVWGCPVLGAGAGAGPRLLEGGRRRGPGRGLTPIVRERAPGRRRAGGRPHPPNPCASDGIFITLFWHVCCELNLTSILLLLN